MSDKEKATFLNVNPETDSKDPRLVNATAKRSRVWIISLLGAASLPILIPILHLRVIGSFLWSQYDREVDRNSCTCGCWDTVFKGQYERGMSSYKHIYFNVTTNTLKIWILTVCYLIALYECSKKIFTLCLKRQIRLPMLILFISVVFPHYYSWWGYFNYLNDEFYDQWYHQIYFTITELLSTVFVVKLLDSKVVPRPHDLLVILSVATFHISASLYDQFLSNVLAGKGQDFQVYRDLGLMIPDLLHFWLPWRELRTFNKPVRSLFTVRDWLYVAAFLTFSWIGVLAF